MIQIKPEWEINSFANEIQFQAKYAMIFSQVFPRLRGMAWHTMNEGYITRLPSENDNEYKKRCYFEGNKAKAQGVLSGVVDWMFRWNGIIYMQELKQPNGKLSEPQIQFFDRCVNDCKQNPPVIIRTIAEGIRHTESILKRNLKINFE